MDRFLKITFVDPNANPTHGPNGEELRPTTHKKELSVTVNLESQYVIVSEPFHVEDLDLLLSIAKVAIRESLM